MAAMRDSDWDTILGRLKEGRCTPFFGAGAGYGTLPLGKDLAKELAAVCGYPLKDPHNLTRVTQFMAVQRRDGMFPKDEVVKRLSQRGYPDFDQDGEPHRIFAEFPLPIYITTNYDDFLMEALRRKGKEPRRETCAWNHAVRRRQRSIFTPESDFEPHERTPVVFHLHGSLELRDSMVLTEDDYFDFLVGLSEDFPGTVPSAIQEAIAETSLIFVGYGLHDWNFRVIHRGLMKRVVRGSRRISVTAQLPQLRNGDGAKNRDEAVEAYMERYFEEMDVAVYWGTAREFARELYRRWQGRDNGN